MPCPSHGHRIDISHIVDLGCLLSGKPIQALSQALSFAAISAVVGEKSVESVHGCCARELYIRGKSICVHGMSNAGRSWVIY